MPKAGLELDGLEEWEKNLPVGEDPYHLEDGKLIAHTNRRVVNRKKQMG